MKMTGNTILITEVARVSVEDSPRRSINAETKSSFRGRRKKNLAETVKANPGMESIELDVQDQSSIAAVAKELIPEVSEPKCVDQQRWRHANRRRVRSGR